MLNPVVTTVAAVSVAASISANTGGRKCSGRALCSLLRFEPGAVFPAHDHPAGEEVFVLEGEVRIGAHLMKPGDYLYAPCRCIHAASSRTGCVFLVTLPKPVVIIEDQTAR